MKIMFVYSPNFTPRKNRKIQSIIIHYTGMKTALDSIKRLKSKKSKVSCHYLIDNSGKIIQMVKDKDIAWHAGISYWDGKKNLNTAINIMTYTLFLIPLGLLPTIFGITGIISGTIAVVCAILFLIQTIKLIKDYSRNSALRVMFGSFIYLPIVQISYIVDKI